MTSTDINQLRNRLTVVSDKEAELRRLLEITAKEKMQTLDELRAAAMEVLKEVDEASAINEHRIPNATIPNAQIVRNDLPSWASAADRSSAEAFSNRSATIEAQLNERGFNG